MVSVNIKVLYIDIKEFFLKFGLGWVQKNCDPAHFIIQKPKSGYRKVQVLGCVNVFAR